MVNWGVLATGHISTKFANGLKEAKDSRLYGVASRTLAKAEAFAEEHGFSRAFGSYEELASCPEVDVVYIGTVNTCHHENAMMCLGKGKHVLCEKPFAMSKTHAEEMIGTARSKGLFIMEALWNRFQPIARQVDVWAKSGAIGEVRQLIAEFGFETVLGEAGRHLNPGLGGGAVVDVGIYPLTYANMLFGMSPTHVSSTAMVGGTGVDEQSAMLLGYGGGAFAMLSGACTTRTGHDATVYGTLGRIEVKDFWRATKATLEVYGGDVTTVEIPFRRNGYEYEIEEVNRCVSEGRLESPSYTHGETLYVTGLMEGMRKSWGMGY